ncbi:DUF1996 domain-containing protein [Streptomyces sp. NBC_00566]|uniref:DUF1996 domain-containing protein n=1 Tax=Streptomyces sp. NBC_00566 TaxID=2975778 RepID=UPI002E81422C|nr:DUF1996 domain-containing protein [Streptomyces sp. NBC_00566]WUB90556.1 DUF1996 domain-containing protein [Streptomyces sp. NBC_00566]
MLGGGGLVAANVYASASEGGWGKEGSGDAADAQLRSAGMATVDCPDVGARLTDVPEAARGDVDRELAQLDQQIAEAYQRLQQSADALRQDPGAADNSVMNPLKDKRTATLGRIADAIGRAGNRPDKLDALAPCTLRPAEAAPGGEGQESAAPTQSAGQGQNGGTGQGGNGPVAADYVDINSVQPNAPKAPPGGTFRTECGVNENGLFNSDNVIVAPGVSNGAHHFHDYVGNQSNTAFASDQDLADAKTSCADQGDRSTYYWPVLRLQNGKQERDAGAPGGGTEGNAGEIVTPKEVTLTFVGSPSGQVTEMPRLLRIITGDAKAFVNGPANANASWSCTGFEDRQLKDKYPLCPSGSDVVRSFHFQSCWDGRNADSANHRTHVAFADAQGNCPGGFKAIPQLVQRIVYDVDAPSLADGGKGTPLFAVDSFPEQQHKPVTDHGDFINVFDEGLMRTMVDCINSGRECGPGDDGKGDGGKGDGGTANPSEEPGGQDTAEPSATAAPEKPAESQPAKPEEPAGTTPAQQPAQSNPVEAPRVDATTAPANTTKNDGGEVKRDESTAPAAPAGTAGGAAPQASQSAPAQAGAVTTPPPADLEPQAVGSGGLAETGANLWPAALGVLLAASGLVMLLRARRLRY